MNALLEFGVCPPSAQQWRWIRSRSKATCELETPNLRNSPQFFIPSSLRSPRSEWHLKVAFHGTIEADQHPIFGKGLKRRNDLQDLSRCIDFRQIRLLDDTVTEVILSVALRDTSYLISPE